ncbi:MAG TPA: tetratricopeptide repeat protein, partial [Desulfuromonadaceae bacterium]|nr:tetratricopeptide repeat protein [Desulfuromonadaceae bacterium]
SQFPYLAVGWFWFLGTLVPVIGLVQVGAASIADRYTYLPSIGFFIMLIWGFATWNKRSPATVAIFSAIVLAMLLAGTSLQLKYWRNDVLLLSHTVRVTSDNYTACNYLGDALERAGLKSDAEAMYRESVRIEPRFPHAQYNLAMALWHDGRAVEASEHLTVAAGLVPTDAGIQYFLGETLMARGQLDEAARRFGETLKLQPDSVPAHLDLAIVLVQQHRLDAALPHFAEAARLRPGDPEIRFNYGLALLDGGRPAEAADQFTIEIHLAPGETRAHYRLAQALARQGKFPAAATRYREALQLTPAFPEAQKELDEILAAHPEAR